ncbi:TIGR04255 family protein [Candidatus Poriferisocius sp.]|uniref:TIGR04255 family protein n=1 Tax=Candidatus Poriferisocius sp. TaxID=3101276 RepID=UPI003B0246A8
MPGSTPPFPNPPLVLTVLEIRYPEIADGLGDSERAGLKSALNEYLPLMESQIEEQFAVAVGASAPASVQRRMFPRFGTRDRTTALLVKQDALVLETTAYAGWEEHFRPLVSEAIVALERVSRPDGVLRVGLRYIDEIRVPGIESAPGDWRGYIDKHLLAGAAPEFIPEHMRPSVWQGVAQYQTTAGSTLVVRYGPQEGYAVDPQIPTRRKNPSRSGLFFLLDSDSFWLGEEQVPEFNADWILERCDLLHAPVREFFQIAVTDKLRDEVFSRLEGDEQWEKLT